MNAFYLPEHLSASLEHLGTDRYHLFVNGRWTYAYYDPGMLMCAYREFEYQGEACTVVCDGEIVFYCARLHPLRRVLVKIVVTIGQHMVPLFLRKLCEEI